MRFDYYLNLLLLMTHREMTKLFKSYICFQDRIGERHNVLVTEMAKDGHHLVGHNKAFDHFLVPPANGLDLMGKIVCVEITEAGKYFIRSKVIDTSSSLWVSDGMNQVKRSTYVDRNNYVYVISIASSFLAMFMFLHYYQLALI